jgi:hypothetical protein
LKLENVMNVKRIIICALVALIFSAASVNVACDVSCSFAPLTSDCHSAKMENQSSNSSEMNMEGMDMPGMTMPQMGASESDQKVTANSRAMAAHSSIGVMGICEKQSCGGDTPALNIASRDFDSQFHIALTITGLPLVSKSSASSHDARDGIRNIKIRVTNHKRLSLRI